MAVEIKKVLKMFKLAENQNLYKCNEQRQELKLILEMKTENTT